MAMNAGQAICALLVLWCAVTPGTAQTPEAAVPPQDADRVLNFVVIPDAHTGGGRLVFLPQIVDRINALEIQPDFVVSLGDNVSGHQDHPVLEDAIAYQGEIARLKTPHYYVIGNHECIPVEVYKLLTWDQLLGSWNMTIRWYGFDVRGFRICVLDGWISLRAPAFADDFRREQEWLREELSSTDKPVVVFIHQAIGFQQEDCRHWIETDNRKFWPPGNFFETTIEAHADQIVGVFEGHKHKSLRKTRNGVTYHQMGASHQHNGQFAQVFIDPATRAYFVQGHPHVEEQSAWDDVQQTYGDPGVADKLRQQLGR